MSWYRLGLLLCGAALGAESVAAETVRFAAPGLDRWNYPFAGNGAEQEARLFSALGNEGLDERDAQFIVAFDTANGGSSAIPVGLGAASYQIQSVTLRATVSSVVGQPAYDGSNDSFATYLAPEAAAYVPDADAGRPIELFGVGFVAGYSRFGFGPTDGAPPAYEEGNAFGFGPPTGRYVHPLAFDSVGQPILVSNNVDYLNAGAAGFEAAPFAIGATSLNAGDELAVGTELTFSVDIASPAILNYLQDGLDGGQLGFVLSTLSLSDNFARLYTREFPGGSPVTLDIEYSVVPEPNALVLAALTYAVLAGVMWRQWRRSST